MSQAIKQETEDNTPLAPELVQAIKSAQAEIDRAIHEAKLHDDPLGFTLTAQSNLLSVLQRLFVDGTLAMRRAIEDGRRPMDVALIQQRLEGLKDHIASEIAAETWSQVRQGIFRLRRGLWFATALVPCVLVALAFGIGRWTAPTPTPLVHMLEGAAFTTQVAEMNDAAALREYCLAHVVQRNDDGIRCELPTVWISKSQLQLQQQAQKRGKQAGEGGFR